jgi:hypothetical protein
MKTLLNKKQEHFLPFITIFLALFAMISVFILNSDGGVFLRKTKLFYANFIEKKISIKNQTERFKTASVLAAYPPSVNSLPTCPFSNGDIGDIFAKNSGCSWSDYKCTLTNYDQCNSGVSYYGGPWGDYCWCSYDNSKVCAIQHPSNGVACWSWKDGVNYSEYCNLCVRR